MNFCLDNIIVVVVVVVCLTLILHCFISLVISYRVINILIFTLSLIKQFHTISLYHRSAL